MWSQQGKSLVAVFSKGNTITITPKYAGDAPPSQWYVHMHDTETNFITNKTVFGSSVDAAIRFALKRAQEQGWQHESTGTATTTS